MEEREELRNLLKISKVLPIKKKIEKLDTFLLLKHPQKVRIKILQDCLNGASNEHEAIRSILWKCLLGVIPSFEPKSWLKTIKTRREEYAILQEKFSTMCKNKRKRKRIEEDILSMINKDLNRIYPKQKFFSHPKVQQQLRNILVLFSTNNEHTTPYKQGFHELCGVFLYVCYQGSYYAIPSDRQHTPSTTNVDPESYVTIETLCDHEFIEADTYFMFGQFINQMNIFYSNPTEQKEYKSCSLEERKHFAEKTFLFRVIKSTIDKMLQKLDPVIHDYLQSNNILPQVFLIEWIKCLFCRTFSLPKVLILWDFLFAYCEQFQHQASVSIKKNSKERSDLIVCIQHVCINLLLFFRNDILKGTYKETLELLMHSFPSKKISIGKFLKEHVLQTIESPNKQLYFFSKEKYAEKRKNVSVEIAKNKIKMTPKITSVDELIKNYQKVQNRDFDLGCMMNDITFILEEIEFGENFDTHTNEKEGVEKKRVGEWEKEKRNYMYSCVSQLKHIKDIMLGIIQYNKSSLKFMHTHNETIKKQLGRHQRQSKKE